MSRASATEDAGRGGSRPASQGGSGGGALVLVEPTLEDWLLIAGLLLAIFGLILLLNLCLVRQYGRLHQQQPVRQPAA